jgi:transposase
MDIRERAPARPAAGQTVRKSRQRCGSLRRAWLNGLRDSASMPALHWVRESGHRPLVISGKYRDIVLKTTEAKSHVTLRELATLLEQAGPKVHHASVGTVFEARSAEFKKTLMASEQERPRVARRRAVAKLSRPD